MVGKTRVCDDCYGEYRDQFIKRILEDINAKSFYLQHNYTKTPEECEMCNTPTHNLWLENISWRACEVCHHQGFLLMCEVCEHTSKKVCKCEKCTENDDEELLDK